MTGAWIRELRLRTGCEPQEFAALLGVHSSTLYRWEKAGDNSVRVEPFQHQVLVTLDRQMGRPGAEALCREMRDDVRISGLLGLYRLLRAVFAGVA